jgi:hypothetical protein
MKRIGIALALVGAAAAAGLISSGRSARHQARAQDPVPVSAQTPSFPNLYPYREVRGHDGFWRIAETDKGVWWFLSPQNKTEFLNGVTTVQPALRGRDPRGPNYLSDDWDGQADRVSLCRWAERTLDRVQAMGFKNLGAWCNPVLHQFPAPMTQDLNVWHWVPYDARLYSADWRISAEVAIRQQAEPLRENKNLIGYYIDNELNWDDGAVGPRVYFDQLPASDPNRCEVVRVIRDTWPSLNEFNRDWNTTFHDWSELEQHAKLPVGEKKGYDLLQNRWLAHYARSYFEITTNLIRKYDPNHLILGCRFRGWAPPQVPQGARGLTDAQSLNYYASDALLDFKTFRSISHLSNQPLIVSEYTFHALDGRSGDRNMSRFPALVADQKARADGYRDMTTRLARVPYVIGADWFQWMDEPPSGRIGDGEDANMGVVDIHDKPYESLADAVRRTTPTLNGLHARSCSDRNATVWRQVPNERQATQLAGADAEMMAR